MILAVYNTPQAERVKSLVKFCHAKPDAEVIPLYTGYYMKRGHGLRGGSFPGDSNLRRIDFDSRHYRLYNNSDILTSGHAGLTPLSLQGSSLFSGF